MNISGNMESNVETFCQHVQRWSYATTEDHCHQHAEQKQVQPQHGPKTRQEQKIHCNSAMSSISKVELSGKITNIEIREQGRY